MDNYACACLYGPGDPRCCKSAAFMDRRRNQIADEIMNMSDHEIISDAVQEFGSLDTALKEADRIHRILLNAMDKAEQTAKGTGDE